MITDIEIADIQASSDPRNLAVNKVGIRALKHPVIVNDVGESAQPYQFHTVATFDMCVNLPAHRKGTHMSRFLTMLNERPVIISTHHLPALIDGMLVRLEATSASIEAKLTLLLPKKAPISKLVSFLDYEITYKARVVGETIQTGIELVVPVATLCPCSKEISKYGAHNQRSHVTLNAWFKEPTSIISLIRLIESKASCELYGALKRVDEKFVTEKAYDNPKFVEDLVRDISIELNCLDNFVSYTIASENFESIHNHTAYAEIHYP